eukprot:4073326-Prymnesium_polylepis.1
MLVLTCHSRALVRKGILHRRERYDASSGEEARSVWRRSDLIDAARVRVTHPGLTIEGSQSW